MAGVKIHGDFLINHPEIIKVFTLRKLVPAAGVHIVH